MNRIFIFFFLLISIFSCKSETDSTLSKSKINKTESANQANSYGIYLDGLFAKLNLSQKELNAFLKANTNYFKQIQKVKNSNLSDKKVRLNNLNKKRNERFEEIIGKSKMGLKREYDKEFNKNKK